MANFDTQLQRMKSLMTYGAVNENKKQVNGAMEYHAIGADGKAYGVIRENQKFYIKTADKKNEMVVESYEYIGGFCNKKQYEYTSLSEAKKDFDFKLMSIRDSHSPKTSTDINKFSVIAEEMSVCGKNMMNEIARQRQIMNNAAAIMKESSTIGANNTGNPEAPKTSSFEPKAGPFTETATAELDKDMKASASDPKKQGEPFGDNAKTEESKDAEYVPQGSVANQKPKGGKVVKVDEATKKVWEMMAKLDKTFTLNESCEEWGSCGLPSDAGTGSAEGHLMEEEMPMDGQESPIMEDEEIAGIDDETVIDDAEFEGEDEDMSDVEGEEIPEEEEEDDFDFEMFDDEELEGEEDEEMSDEDSELEGEEEAEADMEAGEDDIDSLRNEIEALKARIAELEGGNEDVESEIEMDDDDFDDDMESEDEFGEEDFDDEEMDDEDFGDEIPEEMEEEFDPEVDANYDDEYEDEVLPESRKSMLEPLVENVVKMFINEEKLNDFGKHPGYRKKPMSLPATGSDEGDWNDESVYSEAPFGEKIGDSAPFDKVVSDVTEKVFESFKKKI